MPLTNTRFMAILALLLAFVVAPASLLAATVGPLDGKPAPALAPMAIPTAEMKVEELPDTSFPESLENMGDLPSAALEWQRIAHKSVGALREQALANAARLHMAQNHLSIASTLVKNLLEESPSSPYAQQALYALATGPQGNAQAESLKQLQTSFPTSPFTQAAQLGEVWKQAEASGKVTQTYNLPQAEELKKRLHQIRAAQQQKIAMASAFGVLFPGAGHAYAGNVPQGITVMAVFSMFMLAFLSACRHKHYAYSFLFVLPAVALWFSSPAVAMQIAEEKARTDLTRALVSYTDLRPVNPLDMVKAN